MCFPTFSAIGSFFLVFSFILELFLIIGQLSNKWFLTKIFFAETWNTSRNLSYSFSLWNYCTGDGNRNIQSCAGRKAAYNWAKTPDIVDLVPDLANSKVVSGLFYALFILIFVAMGLSFIFWLMSLPICCTRHKRAWGYSMSTLCLINFLITLVCIVIALILILSGVRHITRASPEWRAHAGNALWLLIGTCISNFIAMLCYTGGACCSRKSRPRDDDSDDYYVPATAAGAADNGKKKGFFSRFGKKNNKTEVEPEYKDNLATDNTNYNTAAVDNTNYNSLLPGSAQPMYNSHATYATNQQNSSMLQQPYSFNGSGTPVQQNATGITQHNSTGVSAADVSTHGYQTPILQPANAQE